MTALVPGAVVAAGGRGGVVVVVAVLIVDSLLDAPNVKTFVPTV